MDETHSVEEIKKHIRVYMGVFGALAVLTVVTVGIGYLDLPVIPALIIGLLIATIKGGLVAAYFMHLITEKRVITSFLALTAVFLLCMIAIFMSSFADQVNQV
jgi:cytochrome c oxidase subunit 4